MRSELILFFAIFVVGLSAFAEGKLDLSPHIPWKPNWESAEKTPKHDAPAAAATASETSVRKSQEAQRSTRTPTSSEVTSSPANRKLGGSFMRERHGKQNSVTTDTPD